MNTTKTTLHFHFSLLAALAIAASVPACSTTTTAPPAPRDEPPGETAPARASSSLHFVAPCTAAACGDVPASSTSDEPFCEPVDGSCGWQDARPDDVVSYHACDPSACGPRLAGDPCPPGTVLAGSDCGAENDGPCAWRSACVPPPSTTPCESADGCGPMPELGVVCHDGSNGVLACMQVGDRCQWQPSCPPSSEPPVSCEDACGAKPELGVVCSDGSIGDLVCESDGSRCRWRPTCDGQD